MTLIAIGVKIIILINVLIIFISIIKKSSQNKEKINSSKENKLFFLYTEKLSNLFFPLFLYIISTIIFISYKAYFFLAYNTIFSLLLYAPTLFINNGIHFYETYFIFKQKQYSYSQIKHIKFENTSDSFKYLFYIDDFCLKGKIKEKEKNLLTSILIDRIPFKIEDCDLKKLSI